MKKVVTVILLLLPLMLSAQNLPLISERDSIPSLIERILSKRDSTFESNGQYRKITSHINLEFVTSTNASFTENTFEELSFKTNRVRLEIYGRLNQHLSYHFRQSFNRYHNPFAVDNLPSSIEYANITWKHKDKFSLTAGKQFVAFAGYEGYVNGIKVREFCDFNNHMEIFQTGVTGTIHFSPTQLLMLQVVNNRSGADSDVLMHGLPSGVQPARIPLLATAHWNGYFADGAVNLMYSASVGQQAKGKYLYYLMCGNIYEKGPVLAYLDVLYARSSIDGQQRITNLQGGGLLPVTAQNTQYFTLIANVDYRFHPKWNGYVKGAYETAGVYEQNGIFEKGRYMTCWNAQACLEWFPFTEDKGFKVFAHYLYKAHELTENAEVMMAAMPHTQRISLGIVYVIPVL